MIPAGRLPPCPWMAFLKRARIGPDVYPDPTDGGFFPTDGGFRTIGGKKRKSRAFFVCATIACPSAVAANVRACVHTGDCY